MGLAFLEKVGNTSTSGGGTGSGDGFNINGIIKEYYVYAGENISAGDFVNYIEGIANRTITHGVSVNTTETVINDFYSDYAYRCKALLLEDQNRVLLIHTYSSDLHMVLLTVGDGVITVLEDTDQILFEDQRGYTEMVEIDTNKILAMSLDGSTNGVLKAVIITVGDDNTLAAGAKTTVGTGSSSSLQSSLHKLGTNKACAIWYNSTDKFVQAVILTVDGTTVNAGTTTSLSLTGSSGVTTTKINDNQILVVHNGNACYCNISDDVITESATTTINTLTGIGIGDLMLINPTTALLMFAGRGNTFALGTQILHLGTEITGEEVVNGATYTGMGIESIKMMNGKILMFCRTKVDSTYYLSIYVYVFENNALTLLNTIRFSSAAYGDVAGGQQYCIFQYQNDDLGLCYDDSEGDVLSAQIYSLDNDTNTLVPIAHKTTIETTYETQVQKSKADVFNGVAKTAGVGGDDMGHNEKIEIYTL